MNGATMLESMYSPVLIRTIKARMGPILSRSIKEKNASLKKGLPLLCSHCSIFFLWAPIMMSPPARSMPISPASLILCKKKLEQQKALREDCLIVKVHGDQGKGCGAGKPEQSAGCGFRQQYGQREAGCFALGEIAQVVDGKKCQNECRSAKSHGPALGCADGCDDSGAGHHGNTVSHNPVAYETCLLTSVQGFEVIAVNGDVVGGGQETSRQEKNADEGVALGRGVRAAAISRSPASKTCMMRSHWRLLPYRSICGAQKNFKVQGTPKREVSPIPSRLTPLSRKNTLKTVRMIE